jgi:site-specific DNA-methyltransferase (adenine-specific)
MAKPYYEDDLVTLYHGDFRECMPELIAAKADAIVTDPPYGETALGWDTWPAGWVGDVAPISNALWCFGSFRMFMDNKSEFERWKFSHEIIWEKNIGSGPGLTDRFYRVHEMASFWYRGSWKEIHHVVPRVSSNGAPNKTWRASGKPQSPRNAHRGDIGEQAGYVDDGTRLQRSVQLVASTRANASHPTQKPVGIVSPLIEYCVPPGGMVVEPFAGSGTTLLAARNLGRRAVGTEVSEAYCEVIATRLSQQTFDLGDIS